MKKNCFSNTSYFTDENKKEGTLLSRCNCSSEERETS